MGITARVGDTLTFAYPGSSPLSMDWAGQVSPAQSSQRVARMSSIVVISVVCEATMFSARAITSAF